MTQDRGHPDGVYEQKLPRTCGPLQQQADTVTKGLEALQSGLTGLDASRAAQESDRLTKSLQALREQSTPPAAPTCKPSSLFRSGKSRTSWA